MIPRNYIDVIVVVIKATCAVIIFNMESVIYTFFLSVVPNDELWVSLYLHHFVIVN